MRTRAGVTLLELTIVLSIIGTLATVTALGLAASLKRREVKAFDCAERQRRALRTGIATRSFGDSGQSEPCGSAIFLPDGRVVTTSPRWDRLTGAFDATP